MSAKSIQIRIAALTEKACLNAPNVPLFLRIVIQKNDSNLQLPYMPCSKDGWSIFYQVY
jgi:hypothetical protein